MGKGSTLGSPGPTGAGALNEFTTIFYSYKLASAVSNLSNNVYAEIFATKFACSNIVTNIKEVNSSQLIYSVLYSHINSCKSRSIF